MRAQCVWRHLMPRRPPLLLQFALLTLLGVLVLSARVPDPADALESARAAAAAVAHAGDAPATPAGTGDAPVTAARDDAGDAVPVDLGGVGGDKSAVDSGATEADRADGIGGDGFGGADDGGGGDSAGGNGTLADSSTSGNTTDAGLADSVTRGNATDTSPASDDGDGDSFVAVAEENGDVGALSSPARSPTRKLLLAIELCRHGDRAPIDEYPNDVLPASKWPEGPGELTAVGQRAHFDLGRKLRARYVDTGFLNPTFNVRDVYIRSTTLDRTLMSAYSQMAGMFPAGTASIQDVGSNYGLADRPVNATGLPGRRQPVPIHSESIATDALLLPGNNCPRFTEVRKELRNAPAFVERTESEKNLLSKLAGIVGLDSATLMDAWTINDIWVCSEAHGVPLPADATPAIRKALQNLADWILLYGNQGLETRRLSAGLLLNEIKTRLELSRQSAESNADQKQATPPSKKFVLYSAHDSTLAAALSALNIEYTTNPPYNSTLIWELSQESSNGEFYVQVEYNGRARRIPGCGLPTAGDKSCTLRDYIQATQAVTVPGGRAREIECMVGMQRKLAKFAAWFTRTPKDIIDGGTQQPPERPVHNQSGAPFYVFILVLGCIVGAFIMRAKTSFDGYFPTKAHDPDLDPTAPIRRLVKRSERGILL